MTTIKTSKGSRLNGVLIVLATCAGLLALPAYAGGVGNGNGNGNGGNNNIQARVDALEVQAATLTQGVQDISQQLTVTQGDVTDLQTSDASQTQTLQTLSQQLTDLQQQLQATQSQLTAADGALQAQVTALSDKLAQTQGQLNTLSTAVLETQKQLDALQTTDSGLQSQVDALKDVDAGTQQGLSDLQQKLIDLQWLLDDYKKTTASQEQLAELQTQIGGLQSQIDALKAIDPAQFYKRDGSAALTGPLAGGGQDAVNLNNISAAGTVNATKVSAVNITPELVVVAGSTCDPAQQGYFAKDSSGLLLSCQSGSWKGQAQGGVAAWVNFDGTNCPGNWCAIRAGNNVSGVWRNATGLYTVYFTSALPDTNYMGIINVGTGSLTDPGLFANGPFSVAPTTGAYTFQVEGINGARYNVAYVQAQFVR